MLKVKKTSWTLRISNTDTWTPPVHQTSLLVDVEHSLLFVINTFDKWNDTVKDLWRLRVFLVFLMKNGKTLKDNV